MEKKWWWYSSTIQRLISILFYVHVDTQKLKVENIEFENKEYKSIIFEEIKPKSNLLIQPYKMMLIMM